MQILTQTLEKQAKSFSPMNESFNYLPNAEICGTQIDLRGILQLVFKSYLWENVWVLVCNMIFFVSKFIFLFLKSVQFWEIKRVVIFILQVLFDNQSKESKGRSP